MDAVVVLSGGLDSATALALASQEHEKIYTISFDYGQRHRTELEAARSLSSYYNTTHYELGVILGKGGVLMNEEEMPQKTYEELAEAEGPSPTYVPYRNGTFLSLAASHALANDCELIYAGMHAEDAHNWAYPDCTPEFIGAMQNAIYVGTYHKVRLICPFTYMEKWQIINEGIKREVPFEMTHSCYEGVRPACGSCPTCVARLRAFRMAGIEDPLPYRVGSR